MIFFDSYSLYCYYSHNLSKVEEMGCIDSRSDPQMTGLPNKQINIISEKMIQKANHVPIGKLQDLSVSDYDAFLTQSKTQKRTDYPSAFQFIKITPISDPELAQVKKEEVFALNCTRAQLINLCVQMIMQNSFACSKFKTEHLGQLITEIADHYHSISYHNFTHGFSLMQMLYKCFKLDTGFRKFYSDQDLTYYLIAGITHDVNHKGTNNLFEQKMKTQLATLAENDAILQRMHIRTFMQISKMKPEFDIFAHSSNPKDAKQKLTRVILATDMKRHFQNLKLVEDRRKQAKLDFKNEEVKILFMENLVHACDIGNSLLPFEEYATWGGLLTYQFNEQTKLEEANKVPVTEFLRYKGLSGFYDDQIGFLGTFVIPLWKEISVSFSGISKICENSTANLNKIKALKSGEKTN